MEGIWETLCKEWLPFLGVNAIPIAQEFHWSRRARRSNRILRLTTHPVGSGSGGPRVFGGGKDSHVGERDRERWLDARGAAFAQNNSITIVISSKTNNCRVSS